ncbi:hypothetical protein [Methylomonas methanica]|uniref:Putative inner membrane protein n=1 Tax=Methylomonas methanica (strain DSM 25384 / MC09) TaxID=857087 RepID=G0A1B4_METMM|nr:hypothetical protein [Methylomonas methanica]AEG02534.1 putative inner membrane protein [Methylomonas methanica MC09]
MLRIGLNGLIWAVTLSYPFLVWYSLDYFQPRSIALALAAVFLLRLLAQHSSRKPAGITAILAPACLIFLLAIALANETRWLLSYPVLVSLSFFAIFAYSLLYPPSAIERLARLEDPDLPAKGVAYTRKVTWVWSVFFFCNAGISLATLWYGDPWLWSFYNGCLFYILMGLLMAGEMLIRRKVKASY